MRAWLLLLPGVALLILAAHYFRDMAWPGLIACGVLVLLLPLRQRWVPALLQVCLVAGAAQWLWTAAMLVQQRTALGRPWGRLALILGGVALLTAASALVFRSAAVQAYYRRA
jgi:hypothetical protein